MNRRKRNQSKRMLFVCGALVCLCCGSIAIQWLLYNVPVWVWIGLIVWGTGVVITYRIQVAVKKAEQQRRLSKCRNYLNQRNL